MKKNKKLYVSVVIVMTFIFASCKKDEPSFLGNVNQFSIPPVSDSLKGKELILNDIYTGNMAIKDSLIIFSSDRLPDYNIYIFDMNSGNLLNRLCRRGKGYNEYISIKHKNQFTVNNENLCLWIYDNVYTRKISLLNISESMKQKETIYDTTYTYTVGSEYSMPLSPIFIPREDSLFIAKNHPQEMALHSIEYLLPAYHLYNGKTNKEIKEYQLFSGNILPSDENVNSFTFGGQDFFDMQSSISPDGKKIAMAMHLYPQINILDMETGELTGCKISKTIDLGSLSNTKMENLKRYFLDVYADNNYIYALYSGTSVNKDVFASNQIFVFDWKGNILKNIVIDNITETITIADEKLYIHDDEDRIFSYDLSLILSE